MSAIKYNKYQAEKYGWDPSWFGCETFDASLVEAIKDFQRSLGLSADGMCGPSTYRRIYNDRTASIMEDVVGGNREYIVCAGNAQEINWKKVVHWEDAGGLKAKETNYRKHSQGFREVDYFVNHWDVCLSSKRCQRVLDKRGISVHFLIDNDGTIYQTMDTNDIAWHAGSKTWNAKSIGVEIANAYYPKWQDWYEERGFGSRPVVKNAKVHGRSMETHLGFYNVQIQAAKALWKAISEFYDIPLQTPTKSNGEEYGTVYKPILDGKYKGIIHHYNLTKRKIDCGGFDITKYLD